jgi:hypothetical protein
MTIYQTNLDAAAQALWTGDLALMLRHVALPVQLVSEDAEFVATSPDEIYIVMTDFLAELNRLGADRYQRVCRHARFVPGQTRIIVGQHDSFILKNGTPLRPPLVSDMTMIECADGLWRCARIELRSRNVGWPIISPDMAASQRDELKRFSLGLGPGQSPETEI